MKTTQLLGEWLATCKAGSIKPRTYARYCELCAIHLIPQLGDCEIASLTRRRIYEFLTERRSHGGGGGAGLSNASINLILTVLRLALEYACDMEYIEWNPCERIRRTMAEGVTKRAEAFTRQEQKMLEEAIEKSPDTRLCGVLLCLYTGLRIGELIGLEWTDFKENCRLLSINRTVYRGVGADGKRRLYVDVPKTQSSLRVIPLPHHIADLMRRRMRESKCAYVIANERCERMSTRSYQYIFERLTEAAGIRRLNFHALRHTFATRALECGMDIKTLSEIMGHKSASITLNRYAHSMMETKIKMMNKMTRIG